MKTFHRINALVLAGILGTLAILLTTASSLMPDLRLAGPTASTIQMKLGTRNSVSVKSPAVDWRENKYHLVSLDAITFTLDESSGGLKADAEITTMSFDDVVYDVSVAVFDGGGQMLGTARAPVTVQRVWLGNVFTMSNPPLALDFGVSLDYSRAKAFMVSISRRKVLTPDEWQTAK